MPLSDILILAALATVGTAIVPLAYLAIIALLVYAYRVEHREY